MQAAGQLLHLLERRRGLHVRLADQRGGVLRGAVELALREPQQVGECEQALLRAVVQVALDPAPLLVGRVHHARA